MHKENQSLAEKTEKAGDKTDGDKKNGDNESLNTTLKVAITGCIYM